MHSKQDIRLLTKEQVYYVAVRSGLLYGYETKLLKTEDIRKLLLFDRGCIQTIARAFWDY